MNPDRNHNPWRIAEYPPGSLLLFSSSPLLPGPLVSVSLRSTHPTLLTASAV